MAECRADDQSARAAVGGRPGLPCRAAIREAKKARETGEKTVILTALCGHGHFDLPAYDAYLRAQMVDEDVTDARLSVALETLPEAPVG